MVGARRRRVNWRLSPQVCEASVSSALLSAPRHLYRSQKRSRLIHALLKLCRRVGISHDSSASLQERLLPLHQHRANAYAGVKIACEIRIEHRTAIDAAACGLQFFD